MIDKLTAINISQEVMTNGTKFEQVSAIAQQPYFIAGMIIVFGTMILLWFIFSFSRISKSSKKLCWSSWINLRAIIFILLGIILYILIFIFPVPTYWI